LRVRTFPLFFLTLFPISPFLLSLSHGFAPRPRPRSRCRRALGPVVEARVVRAAAAARLLGPRCRIERRRESSFLFSPSTMTTKPKLFFVQPSSPARSFVLLHEDRERSRCDISKEESPRQALKTWLRSALVGFEIMLRLDDSAPPPPSFLAVGGGPRRMRPCSSRQAPPFCPLFSLLLHGRRSWRGRGSRN
jgi:hypothetical protein